MIEKWGKNPYNYLSVDRLIGSIVFAEGNMKEKMFDNMAEVCGCETKAACEGKKNNASIIERVSYYEEKLSRAGKVLEMMDGVLEELTDAQKELQTSAEAYRKAQEQLQNTEEAYRKAEEQMQAAHKAYDAARAEFEDIQEDVKALEKYYTSSDWMADFEADEAGLLPEDLKRGVLSEDGIDHLLDENDTLINRIHSIE